MRKVHPFMKYAHNNNPVSLGSIEYQMRLYFANSVFGSDMVSRTARQGIGRQIFYFVKNQFVVSIPLILGPMLECISPNLLNVIKAFFLTSKSITDSFGEFPSSGSWH